MLIKKITLEPHAPVNSKRYDCIKSKLCSKMHMQKLEFSAADYFPPPPTKKKKEKHVIVTFLLTPFSPPLITSCMQLTVGHADTDNCIYTSLYKFYTMVTIFIIL